MPKSTGRKKLMNKAEWFVVMSKPGRETDVTTRLKGAGFNVFYPKLNQYSKKRSCYIVQPLFPLYIFVQMDMEKDFKTIHYTRGVLRILGIGKNPHPISLELVLEIKKRCNQDDVIDAKHCFEDELQKGDKVQITNGPLEGVEAVVSGIYNDRQRVEILFELIKISVDKNNIKKL